MNQNDHTGDSVPSADQVGVTTPRGFTAAGVTAGIKASGRPDVALVVNEGPLQSAAAVLTSNRVHAAPVAWTRQAVANGLLRAVVLNSGGANACTGAEGYRDTVATAQAVAAELAVASELAGAAEPAAAGEVTVDAGEIAVCSTGLIGLRLPMDKLLAGVREAAETRSDSGGPDAATAIMTTDSVSKQASLRSDQGWSIGGMAKGAGMLAPGLATMLVVLTTDAVVEPSVLHRALSHATERTFARLDSDGCMSTNDTVVVMASGASGVAVDQATLAQALQQVCHDLAQQLMRDAEGASHDIAVVVTGAASVRDALEVGRSIARNNLFKCAIYGNDPNWGRVLAAIGTTRATFDPDLLDVSFNGVMVCRGGSIGDDRELVDLAPRDVEVRVDLHAGESTATIWTNDLTHAYVTENAEYSS